MPSRLLLLIAVLLVSVTLQAQKEVPAKIQIYGGYSYLSNTINGVTGSHQSINGLDASLAFAQWHNIRFKIDASAYFGTNLGAPQHPFYLMGGAQFSHKIGRESVFVEGLAGDAGANPDWGPNKLNGQTVAFASLVGGGLDTPITRRVAFRVDGGFQYSYFALEGKNNIPYRIPNLPMNFGRLSSGFVFQF
jgi:hypothetical protein